MIKPEIWVTRPVAQAKALLQSIEQAGWIAEAVPTIEIIAAGDPDTLATQARQRLAAATLAVFVSRNAVDWLWRVLADATHCLNNCRLLAVGPSTSVALQERGNHVVVTPAAGSDSEALLALPILTAPGNEHIIIVRGCGGRELLATTLRARGAEVEYLEVYARRTHAGTAARLPRLWQDRPPAAIVVSSPAGLAALQKLTPPEQQSRLRTTMLVCLGERLAASASEQGYTDCRSVAAGGGDATIMASLQQRFTRHLT